MSLTSKKNLSLFAITWPILIEVFLYMLMGSADTMMLSRVSDDAVAAVGVTNQIISVIIVLFGTVAAGASIIIAQYLGADKRDAAQRVGALAIGINLLFGLAISLLMVLFGKNLLSLMNIEDKLQAYSSTYLLIVGGFLFIQSAMMSAGAMLRVYQFTRDAMYITLGINIINVFGNALFIFGLFGVPMLGVTGVAISTVVSKLVGLILLLIILAKRLERTFSLKDYFSFKKEYVLNILKIGVPSAGEHFAYNSSQLMITYFITLIGTQALTTRVYVQNISMFVFLFAVAVGQGTQILIGHLVGAKQIDQAYRSCLRSLKISLVVSLSLAGIFAVFGGSLLGIFTDDPEIIRLGKLLLTLNLLLEPGRTFNLVIISSLRGTGDVTFPVVMGVISMWGVSVTLSYVLGIYFGLGLIGMWLAFSADEWFRGILMLFRWRSRIWEKKALV